MAIGQSDGSLGTDHDQGGLPQSLCVTMLAPDHTAPSLSSQGPALGAWTIALILPIGTTGHFMPHGMLAQDIKHRCVGTEGESVAISQLAACWFF